MKYKIFGTLKEGGAIGPKYIVLQSFHSTEEERDGFDSMEEAEEYINANREIYHGYELVILPYIVVR